MEHSPDLDWLDRAARGLDGLLEPRGAGVLAACALGAHATLLVLLGGGLELPSLYTFVSDVAHNGGLGLPRGLIRAAVPVAVLVLSAGLGGVFMLCAGLARTPRASRVVLTLLVLPPWLLHVTWPMVLAHRLGMVTELWTAGSFFLGSLLAWAFEERRA